MNNKILEKLKKWRDSEARKQGKPSYYVLSNDNLYQVIENSPQGKKKLVELKGWGPKKVEKYGDKVLAILNGGGGKSSNSVQANEDFQSTENEEKNSIISVAEYINFINLTIGQFGNIKVRGEINDLSGVQRGLAFFNLRDTQRDNCVMQCVVYRRDFEYLKHLLEEGAEVIVHGSPSMYAPNGSFKFAVFKMDPVGEGAYKKALEKLKKKLESKGYFASERKKPLPYVIKNIGLITSKNGAAIEDFRKNLENYGFRVYLRNVYVEGAMAEDSVIGAIKFFNRINWDLDALVLIRGGGGWESLKTFNEERLVEAVVESRLPLITGIGHQKDETLVGMASDADYSTPSIVATFLSEERRKVVEALGDTEENMKFKMDIIINRKYDFLLRNNQNLKYQAEKVFYKFEMVRNRFLENISGKIKEIDTRFEFIANFKSRVENILNYKIERSEIDLKNFSTSFDLLNPKKILSRGYSIVYNKKGEVVKSVDNLKEGDQVKAELGNGFLESIIKKIHRKRDKSGI
ncbi:MAG: exodeoxyribonuclease VII large subunit [Candidatus Moraniibacteriota bacterium]